MRLYLLIVLPFAVHAARIVHSNDDGWAEKNIRVFFDALTAAGNDVVLSAPAENQSGTSSSDAKSLPRSSPCQFNSCPANSPATGFNASNQRLNYVNSFPVTSIKHGISNVAPRFFGSGKPEFAVAGPNVGSNLGFEVQFSGTVGAAVYAAKDAGIPSIAFSGASGQPTAWNAATPLYSRVYADLALNITSTVLASGTPYLPANTWLNVNFPEVTSSRCNNLNQFKFVLSRINPGIISAQDVEVCGSTRLPTENDVVATDGCYVSVSVGDANDKTTAAANAQAMVLKKLQSLFVCLPSTSSSSLFKSIALDILD